ncbi:SAM-dependent methyltransferase [Nocardioides sp. HDW12B]|uniref:O-methyltransferase n=1 Tax=Nocardioides sp. HDW12B TaxID=2714939 RepID=UPI00140E85B2|nr:class I SAM-dependent methyltransferase [Nocardioides sp. HDW12B]QIK68111.1 SAM-dependent methyltransferase [Nocardioides sp. HDW12B]
MSADTDLTGPLGGPAPTSSRAPVGGARPVTPVGIVADLLGSVARQVADVPGVPLEARADLARARAIAAGLEGYVEQQTSPPSAALAALEERTRAEPWEGNLEAEMLSGHVEGAFLQMLVRVSRSRQVLEVGMFTGYAALAMAEALPEGGRVVACELDPGVAALARDCFAASPVGDRVQVEVGPASETLARLAEQGETFDLVFLDADKPGYAGYLDLLLDRGLLHPEGLLCVDNTLLQGEPWSEASSPNGRAVTAFNEQLRDDPRVEQVVVPLRDGVTLARRV